MEKVSEIVADAAKPDFPKYEYVSSWDIGFDDGFDRRWGGFFRRHYTSESKDIPHEIRDEYEALLDYYSATELDALREEHGDNIIHGLYETEIGPFADDQGGPWDDCDQDCGDCVYILHCPRFNGGGEHGGEVNQNPK